MNWLQIRLRVLERDNYTCQRCKRNDCIPEVHHKIPKRKGGPDTLDNLISFCHKCHKIVEPSRLMGYIERVTNGKTLNLTRKTYGDLTEIGRKGETYDDIVARLVKYYRKEQTRQSF
jgi:hypothetical protein